MSKMIPRETIDVLRDFVDISLDQYGIACDLYVPTNLDDIESLDIYRTPENYTFAHYSALVFIQWSPNVYRLKNLGIYVEGEIPIICYLPYNCTNDDGNEVAVDILKSSYFRVPIEYVPANFKKYSEFELVENIVRHMHDAVAVRAYKAVPRRIPSVES